jgi:hypothetical protein
MFLRSEIKASSYRHVEVNSAEQSKETWPLPSTRFTSSEKTRLVAASNLDVQFALLEVQTDLFTCVCLHTQGSS